MDFSALDIVFVIILVIAAFRGAFRGFVTELLSAAAIILGIIGAVIFSKMVGELLATHLGLTQWSEIIAFLVIFLVVYLIIKIFEGALNNFIDKLKLGNLDRALGFFLGIVEGILLISVIVFLMTVQPLFETEEVLKDSVIAKIVLSFLPYGMAIIKDRM
jgi:membrane protein required for colicin V production